MSLGRGPKKADAQKLELEGPLVFLRFSVPAMASYRRRKDPVTGKMREDKSAPPLMKVIGYYTAGSNPNWTRKKEYEAWKDHVRQHTPRELLAWRANTPGQRLVVNVQPYYFNHTHPDAENVRKSIVDAICTGGDKWVAGMVSFPRYDPAAPRVEVEVFYPKPVGR